MVTRFDILLIVLMVYFGDKLAGSRLPQPLLNAVILVVLGILLLLGVVRY